MAPRSFRTVLPARAIRSARRGEASWQQPLAVIDALRARALRILGPFAPELLRDRERRVATYGLVAIALAFAMTFAAPMLLLAVGPIVLGAPHLLADVRYLVARHGLHRRAGFWLCVAGPSCAAFLHPHASVSMFAVVGAALVARASIVPRAAVALAGLALVLGCVRLGAVADVVLAHLHNAIAVALFCLWSRRRSRLHWIVVGAFVLGTAAIAFGALDDGPVKRMSQDGVLDAELLVETLAPVSDPVLSVRAVLVFAFAQSVHYAVWIRLVPEEDRPRTGLRSFASSLRALAVDVGAPLVVVASAVTAGLVAWACVSLADARDGYLRLAVFHGPLELGAATLLVLEQRQLRSREGPRPPAWLETSGKS